MKTIGIDEVGRGPIAGPVVLCEYVLHEEDNLEGIKDSKKLSEKRRYFWKEKSKGNFHIAQASNIEIDEKGISFCIKKCIEEILNKIADVEDIILLDGSLRAPDKYINQKTIIKGDEKEPVIAMASIVAKIFRDELMKELAKSYPNYGFEENKGYGTKDHYKGIKEYGVSEIHRKSFL